MVAWQLLLLARLSLAGFSFRRRAAAQGLVEYALIIMLIAIVVIGILSMTGRTICTTWYDQLINNGAWGSSAPAADCPQ